MTTSVNHPLTSLPPAKKVHTSSSSAETGEPAAELVSRVPACGENFCTFMHALTRRSLEFQRIPVFAAVQLLLNCIYAHTWESWKFIEFTNQPRNVVETCWWDFFSFAAPFTGQSSLSKDLNYWNCWNILFYARQQRAAKQNFNFLLFCGLTNAVCTRLYRA